MGLPKGHPHKGHPKRKALARLFREVRKRVRSVRGSDLDGISRLMALSAIWNDAHFRARAMLATPSDQFDAEGNHVPPVPTGEIVNIVTLQKKL